MKQSLNTAAGSHHCGSSRTCNEVRRQLHPSSRPVLLVLREHDFLAFQFYKVGLCGREKISVRVRCVGGWRVAERAECSCDLCTEQVVEVTRDWAGRAW